MAKKKKSEKGYDMVKRNIDFSHIHKHQRHKSRRKTEKQKKVSNNKKEIEDLNSYISMLR